MTGDLPTNNCSVPEEYQGAIGTVRTIDNNEYEVIYVKGLGDLKDLGRLRFCIVGTRKFGSFRDLITKGYITINKANGEITVRKDSPTDSICFWDSDGEQYVGLKPLKGQRLMTQAEVREAEETYKNNMDMWHEERLAKFKQLKS